MGASPMRSVYLSKDDVYFINDTHITYYIEKQKKLLGTFIFESEMKDTFHKVIKDTICNNRDFILYFHGNIVHEVQVENEFGYMSEYSSKHVTPDSAGPIYTPCSDN